MNVASRDLVYTHPRVWLDAFTAACSLDHHHHQLDGKETNLSMHRNMHMNTSVSILRSSRSITGPGENFRPLTLSLFSIVILDMVCRLTTYLAQKTHTFGSRTQGNAPRRVRV
jgi:hypothetical protein